MLEEMDTCHKLYSIIPLQIIDFPPLQWLITVGIQASVGELPFSKNLMMMGLLKHARCVLAVIYVSQSVIVYCVMNTSIVSNVHFFWIEYSIFA